MSWRASLTFVALCLIWGFPYFLIKLALVDLSPACIAWGRIALGAAILLPIAWQRDVLRPAFAHKGAVCAFAFAELVIPFSLIALGERWISSSLAGILIATVPMTVVLVAPLFGLKEPLGMLRLAGLAIGFFGVVALLGIDGVHGPLQWAGVACMLAAVGGYAAGPLIVQRYLADVDELGSLVASLIVAAIVLLPVAALSAPDHMPSAMALISIAILGVACTALALLLYFYLINAAGAARASVVAYINPAVAAVLGVLILKEHFGIGSIVGLGLILFGSWLATRRESQRQASASAI
jgi:drug/metabolite transporter (DMT)-like permease